MKSNEDIDKKEVATALLNLNTPTEAELPEGFYQTEDNVERRVTRSMAKQRKSPLKEAKALSKFTEKEKQK
ncbi:hypothetical protein N9O24_00815 [bacterium]|nr:hypothetical protein [bacterium]